MRAIPILVLLLGLAMTPAHAGDDETTPAKSLLDAVRDCPLSLGNAMHSAYGADHRPLDAEFVLDTDGHLLLRATVHVQEGDASSFESWIGRVHAGGWVPYARPLTDGATADAERRWTLIQDDPDVLRRALRHAVGEADVPGPAQLALSVGSFARGETYASVLRVVIDDRVRGMQIVRAESTYALAEPTASPEPIRFDPPELPALAVEGGHWFNADEAPSLDAWRGSPVLVVITDPG